MAEFSTDKHSRPGEAVLPPDGLSVKRWLILYALYLLALMIPIAVALCRSGDGVVGTMARPREFFTAPANAPVKLLIYAIYVSVCCTMLPLPTGWMVAALATRDVAVGQHLAGTILLVATVGAAGSTIANLHDYHVFTWLLRRRSVARVRQTKTYRRAERWFARRPFVLLVLFNVLPIPIDVARMLAATYRYPLRRFAAANFIGRWIRYAAIAAVTFQLGEQGWWMVAALLALAVAFGVARVAARLSGRRGGPGGARPRAV